MGYFQDLISRLNIDGITLNFGLFSFGLSLTIVTLALSIISLARKKKDRWKANTNMDRMIVKQKDSLDKLISAMEKQAERSQVKLNAKVLTLSIIVLAIVSFIMTLQHFKNLPAAVLLAATIYSVPDYIFFLLQDRLNKKIEDQVVVGVRVFTSEYIKSRNIEKSIAETSKRVLDPVGGFFSEAYADMLMGLPMETVISKMGSKSNNEYWRIFTQLLYHLKEDSTVINLFTDLVTRIERHIEMTRHNDSSLTSERVLGFIMALTPIPSYLFMKRVVPETTYFIIESAIGRLVLIGSFASALIYLYVDKYSRRIN